MAEVEDEKHLWITTVRWLHAHDSEITPCPQLVNQCLDKQQLQMARDYLTQHSLTECPFHFNQLGAWPAETSHVAGNPECSMLPWVVMEPYRTHWRHDFPSFHFFQYLAWRWSWSPKTVHLRNCWQTNRCLSKNTYRFLHGEVKTEPSTTQICKDPAIVV